MLGEGPYDARQELSAESTKELQSRATKFIEGAENLSLVEIKRELSNKYDQIQVDATQEEIQKQTGALELRDEIGREL